MISCPYSKNRHVQCDRYKCDICSPYSNDRFSFVVIREVLFHDSFNSLLSTLFLGRLF